SLVTVGWMLFRLSSLNDVWLLFATLFGSEMPLSQCRSGLAEVVSIWLLTAIVVLAHVPTDRLRANATLAGLYRTLRPYYLGFLVAATDGLGQQIRLYLFPVLI